MSNELILPNRPRTLDYAVVDVFAESPLTGNPLAIFTDARGLSTAEMQAIAREMNLSETTFVLPPGTPAEEAREREHGVRVRIFTVAEELRFAGHPTLGTAAWLHANYPRLAGAEVIRLDLDAGSIPVTFRTPAAGERGTYGVYGTMRQNDAVFGDLHDAAGLAPLLGLEADDLDPALPPQTVSTGMPFVLAGVRSAEAIGRIALLQRRAAPFLAAAGANFLFCVAPAAPGTGADFHNRLQFYNGEDPATGSASGCAIAWLVRHGVVPAGRPTVFAQGMEMARPSQLDVRAGVPGWRPEDGAMPEVFVGGRTIPVAKGQLFLG